MYTDKWKADDGIVLDDYKHTRINHSKIIAERKNDLNGLANFCGWSKSRLQKFKRINRSNFYLILFDHLE